jgi:hypothetical protein
LLILDCLADHLRSPFARADVLILPAEYDKMSRLKDAKSVSGGEKGNAWCGSYRATRRNGYLQPGDGK